MTPEELRTAYEAHLLAVNTHDLDAVMATFHDDCYVEDLAFGLRVGGKDAVERYYEQLFHMFHDARMIADAWAFGENVVVVWGNYRLTIPGPFLGSTRNVGPLEIASGVTIASLRDGLIESERIFLNLGSICDDVGVSIDRVRSAVRALMT